MEDPMARIIQEERALGNLQMSSTTNNDADSIFPRAIEDIKPINEIESEYARHAWELHGKNYTATAKSLGIAVNTLKKYLDRIRAFGLKPSHFFL